ncbi:MAG: penicillin-binding protein 2 [Gammaproteobacteria bacterium]|nr:MAG: penicillin-binding protein 2 [Gammaproteobacteria bacterium]RLA52924.1 MAG: penicillin-binding protein 2 [Gammaproteobacteria bacterium]
MRDYRTLKNTHWEARLYAVRIGVAVLAVLIMLGGLVWRYYDLQINRHQDFVTQADNNRIHVRAIPPARGLVFDRNGVLLADNRPGFTLSIVIERSENIDKLLAELDQLLDLDEAEIERFNKFAQQRRPYESVPLRDKLSEQEQSILAVNEYRLDGVEISAQLIRHYPLADQLAHVVGYTGKINERELRILNSKQYAGIHTIGKTGLEKYYETDLLGEVGYEHVETNARGRVMRVLERIDPVPGENLHLYLDSRLQEIAMAALGEERGAVVAIETETGGVLALASTPSFDPNLFVTGISHKNYDALVNSPERPLFDRASRGQYPPGSTVKPVFGLAALDSGIISPSYTVYDPGFYQLDNKKHKYRDWKRGGHGSRIDIHKAIEQSCDTFFYTIGFKAGIDRLHDYGELFGFGVTSGIDLPGEARGIMPSKDWKHGVQGVAWYPGDTVNVSIGQGFMLATPIQLAVATSRLATRGLVKSPRLVIANENSELTDDNEAHDNEVIDNKILQIGSKHWQVITDAMVGVVHNVRGTASRAVTGLDYKMAGKTGTAQVVGIKQNEKYDAKKMVKLQLDHALFIAFAPADNPRIAVAVIVENGEHGSSTAAPVARNLIDAYLQFYPPPEVEESG